MKKQRRSNFQEMKENRCKKASSAVDPTLSSILTCARKWRCNKTLSLRPIIGFSYLRARTLYERKIHRNTPDPPYSTNTMVAASIHCRWGKCLLAHTTSSKLNKNKVVLSVSDPLFSDMPCFL